jgi:hypothetical protein
MSESAASRKSVPAIEARRRGFVFFVDKVVQSGEVFGRRKATGFDFCSEKVVDHSRSRGLSTAMVKKTESRPQSDRLTLVTED